MKQSLLRRCEIRPILRKITHPFPLRVSRDGSLRAGPGDVGGPLDGAVELHPGARLHVHLHHTLVRRLHHTPIFNITILDVSL